MFWSSHPDLVQYTSNPIMLNAHLCVTCELTQGYSEKGVAPGSQDLKGVQEPTEGQDYRTSKGFGNFSSGRFTFPVWLI